MKKQLKLLSALGLMAVLALPHRAAAQTSPAQPPPADPPTGQVATADQITKAQTVIRNGAEVSLFLVQMGCRLKGVNADLVTRHRDGGFTISVRYQWSGLDNGNDYSDIHYKFDGTGRIDDIRVGKTTAVIFTPYSVANRATEVLRDTIRDWLRDAPQGIRNLAEQYLRDANARGLHKVVLQYGLSR